MEIIEDIEDSGMESGNSKDETPERKVEEIPNDDTSGVVAKTTEYDDEPDETLAERLMGLTEMFPVPVRNFVSCLTSSTVGGVQEFYKFSCSATWIFFSSSIILFAPIIFEVERANMEQMQRSQQKQVLLGPNTAMSGVPAR